MDDHSTGPPSRSDPAGPRFESIPKPGGGLRWLTRLDPADEAEYRDAVRPLAGRIERALGPEVFAIRTRPAPGGWRLDAMGTRPRRVAERRCAERSARRPGARRSPSPTSSDCYGSISPETIAQRSSGRRPRTPSPSSGASTRAGVRGLPIGPDPSAILANAVLSRAGPRHPDARAPDTSDGSTTSSSGVRRGDVGSRAARARRRRRRPGARAPSARRPGSSRIGERPGRSRSASETPLSSRRREDPLPRIADRHPLPPDDGGVDPRRRAPRAARGDRRPSGGGPHDRASRHDHRPGVHRQSCAPHRHGPLADERGRPGRRRPRRSSSALSGGRSERRGSLSVHLEGFDEIPLGSPASSRRAPSWTSSPPIPSSRRGADGHISVVSSSMLAGDRPRRRGRESSSAEDGEPDRPPHQGGEPPRHRVGRGVVRHAAGSRSSSCRPPGSRPPAGVTAVHEMSMDLADLEVLLGHRRAAARRRVARSRRRCPSRSRWSEGSSRSAATSRSTVRSGLGRRRCPIRTRTGWSSG